MEREPQQSITEKINALISGLTYKEQKLVLKYINDISKTDILSNIDVIKGINAKHATLIKSIPKELGPNWSENQVNQVFSFMRELSEVFSTDLVNPEQISTLHIYWATRCQRQENISGDSIPAL